MKFSDAINASTPVLVDFFATWCGPCQSMAPVLENLKKKLGDQVTILKVDVDKNPKVAAQFRISGVPTFMIFKEGKVKWRQSGMLTQSQLEQVIGQFSFPS